MLRIRVTYCKGDALRYTGHLDLHKVWERTFRRAQLPLAYSQGFHPQPKIQQACPLPLGFTSLCEILDFWCSQDLEATEIQNSLIPALQPGIDLISIAIVPLQDPPLQTTVQASDYSIVFDNEVDVVHLEAKLTELMKSESWERVRRGKKYDLRQLILSATLFKPKPVHIGIRLSVLPGATGRPEELLDVLCIEQSQVEIIRTALLFS
jgi:radical SAM-linked protein